MSKNKFVNQTTEKLKAKEKNLKISLFVLLGLILGYVGFMSYQMANNSYENTTVMTLVPVIFIVLSFTVSTIRNRISAELRNRKDTY